MLFSVQNAFVFDVGAVQEKDEIVHTSTHMHKEMRHAEEMQAHIRNL